MTETAIQSVPVEMVIGVRSVSLRQLLSHSAGLPKEYEPDGSREESSLKEIMQNELYKTELGSSLEDKKFCYSNLGIRLASYVAQEATAKYFSSLSQELITKPLDMKLTTYDPLVALTYPTSLPHIYEDGEFKVVHKINENAARYAAGGLFSNTEDLCKLSRFFLNRGLNDKGERVLSAKSVDEMFLKHIDCQNELFDSYGLTTMSFERDGIKTVGHLGSHPPYATSLMIDRESGIGVVTLLNTYDSELRLKIPFEILKSLR